MFEPSIFLNGYAKFLMNIAITMFGAEARLC